MTCGLFVLTAQLIVPMVPAQHSPPLPHPVPQFLNWPRQIPSATSHASTVSAREKKAANALRVIPAIKAQDTC